eukprot:CAMPEP_0176240002 /NCGR_PEP_ID=MMETSP0121_2-20121125/29154_1 /TAXON_ID=160619 /ORGANISM="Kryptoperidinium foliaceum, Strain CCMP 1326" /LENGTH=84 /DNA_ID=CAMNT_0017579491 /DNA_START=64 /DNA_END=315 /DNA_ORIENTATION=+
MATGASQQLMQDPDQLRRVAQIRDDKTCGQGNTGQTTAVDHAAIRLAAPARGHRRQPALGRTEAHIEAMCKAREHAAGPLCRSA